MNGTQVGIICNRLMTGYVGKFNKAKEDIEKLEEKKKGLSDNDKIAKVQGKIDALKVKKENCMKRMKAFNLKVEAMRKLPQEFGFAFCNKISAGCKHDFVLRENIREYLKNPENSEKAYSKNTISEFNTTDERIEEINYKWALRNILKSYNELLAVTGEISNWDIVEADKGWRGLVTAKNGKFKVRISEFGSLRVLKS